jgi:hypothetical protein
MDRMERHYKDCREGQPTNVSDENNKNEFNNTWAVAK